GAGRGDDRVRHRGGRRGGGDPHLGLDGGPAQGHAQVEARGKLNPYAPVRAATCLVHGKKRGTGVLVAPNAILTCRPGVGGAAADEIRLTFPWSARGEGDGGGLSPQVERCELAADGCDLALLHLAPQASGAASSLELSARRLVPSAA